MLRLATAGGNGPRRPGPGPLPRRTVAGGCSAPSRLPCALRPAASEAASWRTVGCPNRSGRTRPDDRLTVRFDADLVPRGTKPQRALRGRGLCRGWMPMKVDIAVDAKDGTGRVFLAWSPVRGELRVVDGPGAGSSIDVTLRSAGTVGQVVFDSSRSDKGSRTLALKVPSDGTPVDFWVAGEFGQPSVAFGDAVIEAVETATSQPLGALPAMVRIRRNVEALLPGERDTFLSAFATLNGQGAGRLKDFRDTHVGGPASAAAHGDRGFLPWHRAFILDLERELQAIDPAVALPYWRFDRPAPKVFTPEFMGVSNPQGRVSFTPGHPFIFALFMEVDPHGRAHTSFSGFLSQVPTAARDPFSSCSTPTWTGFGPSGSGSGTGAIRPIPNPIRRPRGASGELLGGDSTRALADHRWDDRLPRNSWGRPHGLRLRWCPIRRDPGPHGADLMTRVAGAGGAQWR